MIHDPIVEEVHQWRKELLAQFGGDVHKLAEHVRRLEDEAAKLGKPVVSMPPRRPSPLAAKIA